MNPLLVVGVGGYYGAGKDEFANPLRDALGFEKLFMSKYLLDIIRIMNPLVRLDVPVECMEGWTWEIGEIHSFNELEYQVGYTGAKKQDAIRTWLQLMGTEVGRKILGEDTWVRLIRDDIHVAHSEGKNVVISGIRYENELALVHEFGGTNVWVTRPGFEPTGDTAAHSSERTLSVEDFDFEAMNDRSLEEFHDFARRWGRNRVEGI